MARMQQAGKGPVPRKATGGGSRPAPRQTAPARGRGNPGRSGDQDRTEEREDRRREGRGRRRNSMDPSVLIGLCIGLVVLVAAVIVAAGHYQPPPPAPDPKAQSDIELRTVQVDKSGNVLSPQEVEAIRQKNAAIEEEKKNKLAPRTTSSSGEAKPKVVERRRAEILLEQQTGRKIESADSGEDKPDPNYREDGQKAPVPGWAKDFGGRPLDTEGQQGTAPARAPAPEPAQEDGGGQNDAPPRKARSSPLAPWKGGGGEGETP